MKTTNYMTKYLVLGVMLISITSIENSAQANNNNPKDKVSAISEIGNMDISAALGAVTTDNQTDAPSNALNTIDEKSRKQGHWICYGKDKDVPGYKDEDKVEEGHYKDNRKSGVWKKYFTTGILQSEITYVKGKPNGYAKIYHANGQLKEEGIWKANKWIGDYTRYYENENPHHEFHFGTKGKREGEQTYYHKNGQKMIQGTWVKGKESGTLTEWYEDGSIKSEKKFNGGTLDEASVRLYAPSQEVMSLAAHKEEVIGTGVAVTKDEEIRTIETFDGNGKHKLYNKSLQISKDGDFVNNKLIDGKWYRYNRDGILQSIEVYKDGVHVGDAPMPKGLTNTCLMQFPHF